ncbi:MAG: molybdopterin-guanine dinucleotide biosynthesis protein B [Gammaproteobacteria bacterium]|nr:molybdopterin-guanine dinucleotide biosynthesis protein B [Gammaproteobacteria bacterium]
MNQARVPVLGFAAYSGVGKTTLLVKLLALFQARGLRVGVIKHAHHDFDVDHPGKDSYELRKAGAGQVLVASRRRWALMAENEPPAEPRLNDLLGRLDQSVLDLVLVEGFRHEAFPKIELHRPGLGHPVLFTEDTSIIAVASDAPLPVATRLPVLDINRPEQIADFITGRFPA